MRRTVSAKQTATPGSRCDRCGLFYQYVHPASGGRTLCRMCLELAGENRADWHLKYVRGRDETR
jgi:hypothetical protein